MTPAQARSPNRHRRRGRSEANAGGGQREVNYRQLRNPFTPQAVFSDDQITAMHNEALSVLEDLGIKVLLPEARAIFAAGGALVDEDTETVRIGREIVEAALASAPRSVHCRAGAPERDVTLELGSLTFQPGAGAPHATDLTRGHRPGSGRDFRELIKLTHHFDVLHLLPPLVEPQDVSPELRHYFTMQAQLGLSDKLPFVFSRGTPQVSDSFEMLRDFRGLSDDEFTAELRCLSYPPKFGQ
ncbi:trimethylamine methyltransferase family protein [Roseovarius amoyensis]|uniref:trimethylamine methyltransferase family protein n=1 Tax=Roseovarius amoyensis TaxID=2211448 RepID=UPI000DBE12FA